LTPSLGEATEGKSALSKTDKFANGSIFVYNKESDEKQENCQFEISNRAHPSCSFQGNIFYIMADNTKLK